MVFINPRQKLLRSEGLVPLTSNTADLGVFSGSLTVQDTVIAMQLCRSLATRKTLHIAHKYLCILHKLIIVIQPVLLQRRISLIVIRRVMGTA
jgi:hypothetical protein